ncbi:MAG: Dabb family protein [Mogibacterium sp.]|nr:Dabb family protein [Mogibacterium sp.]
MKHFVLLKFEPGFDVDAAEVIVRDTYKGLGEALPWLTNPCVYRSCIVRDTNADIMATVDLESEDYLKPYLTHPLHLAMAEKLNPHIIQRNSFDYK